MPQRRVALTAIRRR